MMFREAVLAFLGVKENESIEAKYCRVCKQAKRDDCEHCSRNFEVIKM